MQDKIKVLQLTDAYHPTVDGVVAVVDNYIKQINKTDVCHVACPSFRKKDNYVEKPDFKVIRCKAVNAPENYRSCVPFLDGKFTKTVVAENYDIFHAHSPFLLGRKALKIAKKQGKPIVATLHTQYHRDFERVLGKRNPLVKFMIRLISKLYKQADSVWTVSNASVQFLRQYGYHGDVKVIRNATDYVYPQNDTELIKKVNDLHNLHNQNNVFVFVGRMAMYKNLKLICDALKILKDNCVDYKMLFVGGGFDYDELVKYSKTVGVFDKCIFTGNVKDRQLLQAYYLRGDLLLFPSTFDMASIVQVEASAHKTPAVVVENTCSAEQITDGENGFICKETALSYAEKLEFLSANPELVKTVGENAYKTLYRTWDDVGKEIKQAYKEIIQQYKNKK